MNVQALSDQVLLNHYLSGDQSAISKLIERHSRRVRDYINMMVKDRDVAEDIFQETFIKAVRVIDDGRYTDNGKFLSWILRIAHNQVIDHFRAQRQNKTVTEAEAGYDVLGSLRFAERNVEDAMVSEQIERDVRALVELLPSEQPSHSSSTHHPHTPDALHGCNLLQMQRTQAQVPGEQLQSYRSEAEPLQQLHSGSFQNFQQAL